MASQSDPTNQELARRRQQTMGRQFKFLIPLIYAPVLPLIRLSLRHKPVLRDRLFTGVLVGAFAHGFYLVLDVGILIVALPVISLWMPFEFRGSNSFVPRASDILGIRFISTYAPTMSCQCTFLWVAALGVENCQTRMKDEL